MSRATYWDDPRSSRLACCQADLHLSRFSRCIWHHLSCACWILAFKGFQGMKNWRNKVSMSFFHIKSLKPTDFRKPFNFYAMFVHFSVSNHPNQQISVFFPALFHLISSKPTDFRIFSCHLPYKTVKHQQVSEQRFDLAGHSPVVLVDHNVPKNQSPYYQPGQSKGRNLNTGTILLMTSPQMA